MAEPKKKSKLSQTLGGLVGNILEWYDFAVYGALAEDIGRAFFTDGCPADAASAHMDGRVPAHTGDEITTTFLSTASNFTSLGSDSTSCESDALIESFAVFGGAFLMRPIGAFLFGYIGDKWGRKQALQISVLMMCIATVVMGCLPTKAQAGIAAPILLCLVRLFQGVSVGGELVGSIVYTTEMAPPNRCGMYGSLSLMTAVLGTTFGMGVGAIMHASFTEDELSDWAWRIPFLAGILLGAFALWLRRGLEESEAFEELKADGAISKSPLKDALTKYKFQTLTVFGVVCMWAAGFYLLNVWIRLYMNTYVDPPVDNADGISVGCMVFLCLIFPLGGLASDLVGSRDLVMSFGGISSIVLTVPLFIIILMGDSTGATVIAIMVFEIILASWGAPMCAWMVEAFPGEARYSAVAIGYNGAHALLGGTALLLATILTEEVGPIAPAVMFIVICLFSTMCLRFGSTSAKSSGRPCDNYSLYTS
eukprot:m.54871 g.54871  ORF g.54871 m.54871 type:complete len:479 (-) comp10956_c0_seq2:874-2310(-)